VTTWNTYRPWLGLLVRLGLGVVWLIAAIDKLGNPRLFVQAVRAYDATPEWLSEAIGYGLPVLEFCIAILLILGVAVRLAAIVSGVLFVVFLIGIIQAAARGIQLECGCFGGGGETAQGTTYTLDILRDIGLLILAVYLILWSYTKISVEQVLARNDHVEQPSAKRMRTDTGRRKYNAMLEARKKAARERSLWLNVSLGIVVLLIALVGVSVQHNRAKIAGSLTATHASVANGVLYGKAAAATVDVYEDFQCPNCLNFEKSAMKTVDAAVVANKAQVKFHIMSFLDSSSNGNRYSSRAANAGICASDISVDAFVAYHNVLYGTYEGKQTQPTEGSDGRSNALLEAYMKQASKNVPSLKVTSDQLVTFNQCVATEKHKALVEAITDRASRDGVTGTPTIKVNGKSISPTAAAFTAAVNKALVKGPKPSPSPTASASPSASGTASASTPAAATSSAAATSVPASSTPATSSSAASSAAG
jgi:protein-disulfide isomerase/uncharacterized membrane protein YphA (DoxX/SURF4 family)